MGQKQSSHPTTSSIHLGTLCTLKKKPSRQEKTALISRKKIASWPCPGRRSISRSCDIIIARKFVLSHSERGTWCCAEFRSQMDNTSYPHPGRVHSSSAVRSRTTHIT